MHIDWWTLALQTVNVLILIWILARFFFRPVAEIVAKRQAEASKLLADAATARQEAKDVHAEADKARAQITSERERLIEEARKAAQIEKVKLLARSAEEIAKLRSEAKAAIAREHASAESSIFNRASELSIAIAKRLLKRLPSRSVLAAFLDGLRMELSALPAEARKNLVTAASNGGQFDVVTAAPLSNEEMAEVRQKVTDALGTDIPVAFGSDPALLAGIEFHGANTIVRNTWRADLERIREELNSDGHRHAS